MRIVCVYGHRKTDHLCRYPLPGSVTRILLSDGHHFGGGDTAIANDILRML